LCGAGKTPLANRLDEILYDAPIPDFTGVSSPYEPPEDPEVLSTDAPRKLVKQILQA
jgi:adenylylsulfate kinase-like enzyme